ncbi:MAG: FAD-dependent oxidoreductase [Myxococcota bacterium]
MDNLRREPLRESVPIEVDGRRIEAAAGESVAAALIASGRRVFARSVKYHRPRGPACMGARCDGCLMRVDGVPNVMTCVTPVRPGMKVETQNVWGTARIDLLAAADWFFPDGMDHHHMFTRFAPLTRLMRKIARRIAGVGEVPDEPLAPVASREVDADVLVVGAGPSGIVTANAAAREGASVLLVEELRYGGIAALEGRESPALGPPVQLLRQTSALAVFDEPSLGYRGREDSQTSERWVLLGDAKGLIRVRCGALVLATGTEEGTYPFAGSDRPGVYSSRGARRLLAEGVLPGRQVAVVGAGPIDALREAGATVLGPFEPAAVAAVEGRPAVASIRVGGTRWPCDAVVVAGPTSASYALAVQAGADVHWDGVRFVVAATEDGRTQRPGTWAVGSCTGGVARDAAQVGRAAARRETDSVVARTPVVAPAAPLPAQAADKIVVCRCEDVTLHDIEEAVEQGYRDLESVKRYTGFATGWCQGKQCIAHCARLVRSAGGEVASRPITPRPPIHPIPLAHLARLTQKDSPKTTSHVLGPVPQTVPPPGAARSVLPDSGAPRSLPEQADAVVIGAGIMGLSTAFHLAEAGFGNIVILDKGYLCSGASGRNGGGVRAQWSSARNIALMKESLRLCEDFATQMRINVWFRQGGYLFVARSEDRAKQLEASAELQRAHGLPTRLIDGKDAKRIVPELATHDLVVASYNPDDAVVFPWPFVWGYARACQRLGAAIFPFTEVTEIETDGRRVTGVVAAGQRIRTSLVINAAGAWSPDVARMVDVEMPNRPHRHEICSTEPLKPFLRPLVAELATGLYFSQSMRGEIVGGVSNDLVPPGLDQQSSLRFLGLYGRELTKTMPHLGAVRVLRQWAGCYDITPDGNPIIGNVDSLEGFLLLAGFMGHGFMMAPIIGKRTAQHILRGDHEELFAHWNLRRFSSGELLEESMILG